MSEVKEVVFKGRIVRKTYDGGDYKVFAVDVNRNIYSDIKFTKYGNCTISGEMHDLTIGTEYEIKAIEQNNKYGYGYKVLNIRTDRPHSSSDMYMFLQEILTISQADVLYEIYPDIVERVLENRLDDIDLNKLKGIKEYTFNIIKNKIIENYGLAELVVEFQGFFTISMLKKLYDRYSSIDLIKQKLKENPYKCLCGLARVGFKTADQLILDLQKSSDEAILNNKTPIIKFEYDLKTSKERCLACVFYLLEENENEGHTKMNISELRNQCMKLTPACSQYFVDCLKHKDIFYDKDAMFVSLKYTYESEKFIAENIVYGLSVKNIWNYNIEQYKTVNGSKLSDEQVKILDLICKSNICILNGAGGCVDCDTQYFNGYQWKNISDYKDGEMVLQYNCDGTANLVFPDKYIKNHQDYLWSFKTKYGIDQCLSDEHTVVYVTSRGNIKKQSFADVHKKHLDSGFRGKFITSFNYQNNNTYNELSDEQIKIMVAVFADGSFYNRDNLTDKTYSQVRFHLKKQRKKDRLELLLQQADIKYKKVESRARGYSDYYFNAPIREKHFPKEWYNLTKHQFKIISDEIMYWDGCFREKNRYSTNNKNDADFVQFVYSSLGFRATILINNRINETYITNGKQYKRKSIDYSVSYTSRNLISLDSDYRRIENKTKINEYKTKDGFEYCFRVESGMLVLRRNNQIFITGNCGKSYSTQSVINMLKDNNKSFRLFSPTGKAAKVLADYTKEIATTIHRGLGYMPPDVWAYNENQKLDCDVLIIDEFSMADIFLFTRVLKALDFNKTKLLLIGDNAQLPSVSCGNLLHDFMQSNIIPTVTLTKVFRYGEGGLMKVATDVRNCKRYLDDNIGQFTYFGNNKDYAFINVGSDIIVSNAVALYEKLLQQGYNVDDIQVLTAYKKGNCGSIEINNKLQKVANPNYGKTDYMKIGDTCYFKGDIVIQNVNNYHAKIFVDNNWVDDDETETFIANGETGIIKDVNSSYVLIDFDGVVVKYARNDMNSVGLGYSISIHRSQGSSIRVVILLTPQAHTFMLNSNIIYVGLTRMKEKCFHLGNKDTVNIAIKKKANLARDTWMQGLLSQYHKSNIC